MAPCTSKSRNQSSESPADHRRVSFIGGLKCRIRIPQADEVELCARMRAGDRDAQEQLVRSQIPHVIQLARRYLRPGIELDDLIQMGLVGLLECLETFDPTKSRLSTYCRRSIRWQLSRAIVQDYSVVRRPNRSDENEASFWRAGNVQSLDPEVDLETASNVVTCDVALDRQTLMDKVREAIELLPEKQRHVVWARLGGRKLHEIGDELGVSKERVRQVHLRAIDKLRSLLLPESDGQTNGDAPNPLPATLSSRPRPAPVASSPP